MSDNYSVSRGVALKTTLEESMAAFDRLPYEFREMIRNAHTAVSPQGLKMQMERLPWMEGDPEAVEQYMTDYCLQEYFYPWIAHGLDNPRFFRA